MGGAVGGVASALPDLAEPSTNGNHRKFFHSVTSGALVAYFGGRVNGNQNIPIETKEITTIATLSYLSHLVMDSKTPASIPIV